MLRRLPRAYSSLAYSHYSQELNQADISVVHKAELLERLTAIRKAFEKHKKDKEAAANKAVGVLTSDAPWIGTDENVGC